MYTQNEINKIESEQNLTGDLRDKFRRNLFRVYQQTNSNLIKPLLNALLDGKALTSNQFDFALSLFDGSTVKAMPSDKLEQFKSAVTREFQWRHFNQFGQELK